ncbi:MAG: septum formation initiator family protein [Deltaproteobacteria bacterium]|nr:septum formation initiator family protein [Deltaproteobacteria bacterium]
MPRRWVLGTATLIAAVIVGLAVFGATGFRHYRRLSAEAEALLAQNRQLSEENRRLGEEIERLKRDPAYLEKVARDQIGHVKPGETVFLVPTRDASHK